LARKRRKSRRRKPKRRKSRRKTRGRRRINWSRIKWGTLTEWLLRHRDAIRRRYGDPFTKTGEINDRVLRRIYNDERFLKKEAGSHWRKIKKKIQFKLNVLGG